MGANHDARRHRLLVGASNQVINQCRPLPQRGARMDAGKSGMGSAPSHWCVIRGPAASLVAYSLESFLALSLDALETAFAARAVALGNERWPKRRRDGHSPRTREERII